MKIKNQLANNFIQFSWNLINLATDKRCHLAMKNDRYGNGLGLNEERERAKEWEWNSLSHRQMTAQSKKRTVLCQIKNNASKKNNNNNSNNNNILTVRKKGDDRVRDYLILLPTHIHFHSIIWKSFFFFVAAAIQMGTLICKQIKMMYVVFCVRYKRTTAKSIKIQWLSFSLSCPLARFAQFRFGCDVACDMRPAM